MAARSGEPGKSLGVRLPRTEVRNSRIRRAVGANHRTLSTYLNALIGNGLPVEAAAEPSPPAQWLTEGPGADPVPTFLVLRCRRS